MKRVFYVAILFVTTVINAQDVRLKEAEDIRLKDEMIFHNDSPIFRYDKKAMGNELYVYELKGKEELFNIVVAGNSTESKMDDGKKIVFKKQNVVIQSKKFRERKWDFLIALLLEEKVIDLKGNIDADNLNRFKQKYDENNVNQMMR